MTSRGLRAVAPLAVLALTSCSLRFTAFVCASDSSCGAEHACIEAACAALDSSCTSGLRWDGTAGSRHGQCTPSGPPDAGPVDLAGDYGVAPADLVAYDLGVVCGMNAFCEDFESGSLDPWVQSTNGATEVVDTTKAQHGSHALHITTMTSTSSTQMQAAAGLATKTPYFFTDGATDAWVRFYVYVQSPLPVDWTQFFALQQASPPYALMQNAINSQPDHVVFMNNRVASPLQEVYTTTAFVPDAWTCIVYHVHGASPGLVEIGVNGTMSPQTLAGATMWSPEPQVFQLSWGGIAYNGDPGPHEIWYDNVVLSSLPVDCNF